MRHFGTPLERPGRVVSFQRWNLKTTYLHCKSDSATVPVVEMLQELSGNGSMRGFDAR